MEKNIGTRDKMIRVVVGAVIVTLYSQKIITNGIGYIGLAFAFSILLTALLRKSPFYQLIGLNTMEEEEKE